jgi:tripartite-type tricarboxylate transporter receptor subunit TctC
MTRLFPSVAAAMVLAAVGMSSGSLAQQAYPSKPIRVILVDAAPGANTDIVMRSASPELSNRLGQALILDNRVGAFGITGTEACVKSPPDGYTLCIAGGSGLTFNQHVQAKLPYDIENDIKPVTQLYVVTEVLLASWKLPVNTVAELQALAVSKPGGLNVGTSATQLEIYRLWLANRWKTNLVGIPYKGFSPIVTALVSGEVDFTKIGLGNAISQVKSGKIKALAIARATRARLLPDVPTMAEVGMEDFPIRPWWGAIVPAGTPDAIVARLNSELVRLFREPKMMEVLDSQYLELSVGTPQEMAAFMKTERERIGQLVRQFNIPKQ